MAEVLENELNEVEGGYNPATFANWVPYTVQPGDCLSVLAVRFHTSVQALCVANHIHNADLIRAYQTILVPPQY